MIGAGRISRPLAVVLVGLGMLVLDAGFAAFAEPIGVRAGRHTDYGRIVFDWPSRVAYSVARNGDQIVVRFARPVEADLAPIRGRLGRYVRSAVIGDDGKSVRIQMTRAFETRSFLNGNDVVVDLLAGAKRTAGPAKAPTITPPPRSAARSAVPAGTVAVRTGRHDGYGRIVFDWPSPVGYVVSRGREGIVIAFDRQAAIDDRRLARGLPKPVTGVIAEAGARGLRVTLRAPAGTGHKHFRTGTRVVLDVLDRKLGTRKPGTRKPSPSAAKASPVAAAAVRVVQVAPKPVPEVAQTLIPAPRDARTRRKTPPVFGPPGAIVTVGTARNGDAFAMTFNWREPVGAAVWRRRDALWIAFDRPARIVTGGIPLAAQGLVADAKQYPLKGASILKLTIPPSHVARVDRPDRSWRINLQPREAGERGEGAEPITARRLREGAQQAVAFDLARARGPIWWRDPDVGDVLAVMTSDEPGRAVAERRRYVDFDIEPSRIGLAISLLTDRIGIALERDKVILSGPDGLNVSTPSRVLGDRAARIDDHLLGLARWRVGQTEDYFDNEADLFRKVLAASPEEANKARIALARFYLAHARPAEALGVARILKRQRPSEAEELAIRAIDGAANYLMGHHVEAYEDFDHEDLRLAPGSGPWIGAINAGLGDWKQAHLRFQGTEDELAELPSWLADRFRLLAYEAALAADDLEASEKHRGRLSARTLSAPLTDLRRFLDAFLLRKQGQVRQAVADWAPLLDSRHRLVRARAAMATIDAKLHLGDIEPAEAIDKLEGLVVAWRGDAFEFDLLNRLAELHFERKEYRKGLSRLRQVASYFGGVTGSNKAAETMRQHFKDLYLNDAADGLPPIRALALFREFQELTPPGKVGEALVRRFAERLVKIDLLDQAAELLEHQVAFRLKGEEKAKVGARLAEIRLLDRAPERAIKALEKSRVDAVSEPLARDRRLLRARALHAQDRSKDALAAIRLDKGDRAQRLRAAILWQAGQWPEAAKVLRSILADKKLRVEDREATSTGLLLAVALAMIDDDKGLKALDAEIGPSMAKTRHAKAFKALTGVKGRDLPNFQAFVAETAGVELFEDFLADLKKKAVAETAPGS